MPVGATSPKTKSLLSDVAARDDADDAHDASQGVKPRHDAPQANTTKSCEAERTKCSENARPAGAERLEAFFGLGRL
jgi:hypothetical protein